MRRAGTAAANENSRWVAPTGCFETRWFQTFTQDLLFQVLPSNDSAVTVNARQA